MSAVVPSSGPISFRDIRNIMSLSVNSYVNTVTPIKARYIRFQYGNAYGGGRSMNLGGVRAYSTSSGPNIINSSMSVSSLDLFGSGIYMPSNMVDNNDNTMYHSSGGSEYPWVKIDLGSEQDIYRVELTNRADCCRSRIAGITLQLWNSNDTVIYTSNLIPLSDGSTIYREGMDGYLHYTFWPSINTTPYPSSSLPYPTIPAPSTTTVVGIATGPIRMSDYRASASTYYAKGVPDITDTNLRISNFTGKSKALMSGLQYRLFSGYFHDDVNWFLSQQEAYPPGLITNLTNINTSTNGIVPLDSSWSNYSVEWTGFFFAPYTGTYTFITVSDDASYLWIGSIALSGYTTGNGTVRNGGQHPMQYASGTASLTANTFYPIRIQFGEAGGGDDCNTYFSGPNIAQTSDFTGYAFFGLGAYTSFPMPSARLLRTVTLTNNDGVYYANVSGTGTPTYCLMDSKWDGGGWMMLMKGTRGNTFQYYSSYWTSANTLNASDTTRSNADAKFGVFNTAYIKDVMAFWPDAGYTGGSISQSETWTWLVNNYYGGGARATAITGFSQSNSRNVQSYTDPLSFPGFSSSIWSYQSGYRRFVMGGLNHIYSSASLVTRWGFFWNNEADFYSPDALGGIGMAGTWGGGGGNNAYSGGDFYGCCGSIGLNRTMRFEMYGR